MKLILERTDYAVHAYFETNERFKRMEIIRSFDSTRIKKPKKVLREECDLELSLPSRTYMIFDVKKGKQ